MVSTDCGIAPQSCAVVVAMTKTKHPPRIASGEVFRVWFRMSFPLSPRVLVTHRPHSAGGGSSMLD
ncbi:hypothetical protein SAMN05444168_2369 [Paraburkholderia phenazinium]|uniref:Uncharacterized protein n=1 Tax=Paraburkholderia phenazinium TaxID=60549 RepID=A0A1N6GG18_9BURK|nr:hypothetical protein SAMN05444168_2369 [Paraburkholderia phenazinium]